MSKVRFLGLVLTLALTFLMASACAAAPDEYRVFWVDAWGPGFLNASQVEKLLGVPGDPTKIGDIRKANCNAVFAQVRRRADTCYPSGVGEPYFSSGLTPSDFNALQAMIDAAHDTTGGKQRIEVHGWIVVFATAGGAVYLQHNDPSDPENYWMTLDSSGNETSDKAFDPGHPKCAEYLTNVCLDLVNNFDIDGIHYDYIRFTGNSQGYNPTSIARYNARYGLTGQPSSSSEQFKQWRRDQITALVRRVYAKVQATKPSVKVSGSYVTWNPSPTASTRSAFQATRPYYDVYSDWDAWQQEGIVDISVPMTYYNQATYPNDFLRWSNFIKDRKFNRHAIIGPGIYLNSMQNALNQLNSTRNASPGGNYCHGFSGYSYRVPYNGGTFDAFWPELVAQVTPTKANIPSMPWKVSPTKGHISGTITYPNTQWVDGATVTITGPESRSMLCDGTGFYAFIDLTPGTYTVTASKTGYPTAQTVVNVAIGGVTGNMYIADMILGEGGPPVITNVQAGSITNSSATITWNTDMPSDSQVEYGLTTAYGSSTAVNPANVTWHSMSISGLMPNTLYHYRVISTNTYGTSVSADFTFTTSGPPSITNVQVTNIKSTSATITWNTNAPANSRVDYGVTTSYGSSASDTALKTSHSVTINSLNATTLYHFRCVSTNAYGTATSSDYTFTTPEHPVETVIDNLDPGWTNTSPGGNNWNAGAVAEVPKIGSNYLYYAGDGSTVESSVTRKCRWTPNLPAAGLYDVYVFYQKGLNRNTSAPYKVFYNGGNLTSIQNQYSDIANQGDWYLVGEDLYFNAGTSGYVELTTLTTDTRFVSADAAKWVLKKARDTSPPVILHVTDDKYTTSTTSLSATWAAEDPESSITRYEYAVGTQPWLDDIKSWSNAGESTSVTVNGLNLQVGETYYFTISAVNEWDLASIPVSSEGVTVALAVADLKEARELPNNTPISLPLLTVSARFGDCFYVQDVVNAAGLRIQSNAVLASGETVQVSGRLGLAGGCERALLDCKVDAIGSGTIRPLAMINRSVGGSDLNTLTPGIAGSPNLYNIGLLVFTAGTVKSLTSDGFYLDDGSKLSGEGGKTGIQIWTGVADSVDLNSFVGVIGVTSCYKGSGDIVFPRILARDIMEP